MITALLRELSFQGMNPTIVDEVDDYTSYVGYIKQGKTGTDLAKMADAIWVIKLIETVGTITTVKYASGLTDFSVEWDERVNYTYLFP